MTNKEVRYELMKYFAKELSCKADDFLSDKNKVVISDNLPGDFFSMMCFGHATVAKVDKQIFGWSNEFISKHIGFRCFDGIQMIEVYKELIKYNYSITCGQGALPDVTIKRIIPDICFDMRVFDKQDMKNLCRQIDKSVWRMCEPSEEDVLAVALYDKDRIIGLSSADFRADNLCSIDVEILPEYRQKSLATILTMKITNILLGRNIIPFATGAWSNTTARTVLFKCGYYPAWSSLGSTSMEWAIKIINGKTE